MIDSLKFGKSGARARGNANNASLNKRTLGLGRRIATRLALAATTVLATISAIALTFSYNARIAAATSVASAAPMVAAPGTTQSIEQFAATWRASVNRNAEQITINWTAGDSRDLRASLLAFDAMLPKSPRINVTRREASFVVSAEIAP
ncbi:MAG: hypothetical protein EAZ21_10620 [Betaproteobacteria bacterium]|nr:MAG: hypothetical protein EAZ21_10620 [Betaproteobacteria bacterium]